MSIRIAYIEAVVDPGTVEMQQPTSDDLKTFHEATNAPMHAIEQRMWTRVRENERIPEGLFHYTNMAGLRGIIDSGRIWATDIRYLNDAREFDYPKALVSDAVSRRLSATTAEDEKEMIGRLQRTFDFREMLHLYVASFSEVDDDLHQWRGYTDDTGAFSLGLDLRSHAQSIVKIEYDEARQLTYVDELLDDLVETYRTQRPLFPPQLQTFLMARCCQAMRNAVAELLARAKSSQWRHEQEWRLVIALDRKEQRSQLKFRAGPLGLTPYTEVQLLGGAGIRYGKLPLRGVVLGPQRHNELAKIAMGQYLEAKDIHFMTTISESSIPLRR